MPIYDFRCSKCKHEFEEIVLAKANAQTSSFETEEAVCPRCKGKATRHYPMGARKHLRFHFNYMSPTGD